PSLRREEDERAVLLATLAALYAQGQPIDWAAIYPSGGRHVDLPTYRWQHQRCWLDAAPAAAHGSPERAAPRPPPPAWPGKRLRSPAIEGVVFESQFSAASLPFLDAHRVDGNIVVAGAAQLSLVLSAADAAFGRDTYTLDDVEFTRALALGEQ